MSRFVPNRETVTFAVAAAAASITRRKKPFLRNYGGKPRRAKHANTIKPERLSKAAQKKLIQSGKIIDQKGGSQS